VSFATTTHETGQYMKAIAVKKGQSRTRPAGFQAMGTVRCGGGCGEEFFIAHRITAADRTAAQKQANWLVLLLAAQHQQQLLHPDSIELPE
jgi:hypothetical protein